MCVCVVCVCVIFYCTIKEESNVTCVLGALSKYMYVTSYVTMCLCLRANSVHATLFHSTGPTITICCWTDIIKFDMHDTKVIKHQQNLT